MTQTATTFACWRCGNALEAGQLVCPRCGALVYAQRLNTLAAEAQREEPVNAIRAAMLWREMLTMIPPESEQYRWVTGRVGMLAGGFAQRAEGRPDLPIPAVTSGADGNGEVAYAPVTRAVRPPDPLPLAIAKTVGSMIVSIIVYAWMFNDRGGWAFATGFVLIMLVHELGHSVAMRYYGLSASPPIFIPFLGAVINLRQMPRNALEEAVVGIGGPFTGTIAAAVTYLIYLKTGSPLMLMLAEFGFLLNLFNMLPVPPLDGGRITAAVTPWIWMPGFFYVIYWLISDYLKYRVVNPILILLVFYSWPRVFKTLTRRAQGGPYYQIGRRANWLMGTAYLLLAAFLAVMYQLCQAQMLRVFGPSWVG